jgi:ubiquinone/menaquinone biosynthesis C-methylase UbiE
MSETIVRQQYNKMAYWYDRRWNTYIAKTLSFLKDWTDISSKATVLDIGCGTGEFERLVLAESPQQYITGVDISEEMLIVARQKCHDYPNTSFQIASASALPFASHSFDVIVSASAFHYFDNPNAALREIKRVLKPEGKVVILDWSKDYLLCRICDFWLKFLDPAYKQCYTQSEFHNLLTSAQFEIKQATKFRFGVVWGMMIATATPSRLVG